MVVMVSRSNVPPGPRFICAGTSFLLFSWQLATLGISDQVKGNRHYCARGAEQAQGGARFGDHTTDRSMRINS